MSDLEIKTNSNAAKEPDKRKNGFTEFWYSLSKNKTAIFGLCILVILIFVAIFASIVAPYNPYESNMPMSLKPPGPSHLFGTDELGRDILSRIIYGARISLWVGISSVSVAIVLGIALGAISGYYGGKVDNFIMRIMDIMLAFPAILLAIALMAVMGRSLQNAVIAIGIVAVPEFARIVRGTVLSIKANEYVEAAKAIGNNDALIIMKHIIPNSIAPIIVRGSLAVSDAILEAASLGFLGLGVQPPTAEWGAMLGSGRSYFFNAPHIVTFPGIAITITVLAFNLLGDGLRDALDPRLRQ